MSEVKNTETNVVKKKALSKSIYVPIVEGIEIKKNSNDLDALGRAYATGRRKQSSARLWLSLGNEIKVNYLKIEEYFPQESLRRDFLKPLELVKMEKVKIFATVSGGGKVAQSQALRLALAKALLLFDSSFKDILKEREHYGFRSTRKPPQHNRR